MAPGENITLTSERQTPRLSEQELACIRQIRARARRQHQANAGQKPRKRLLGLCLLATVVSLVGLLTRLV